MEQARIEVEREEKPESWNSLYTWAWTNDFHLYLSYLDLHIYYCALLEVKVGHQHTNVQKFC